MKLLPHEEKFWSGMKTHDKSKCKGRNCPVHNPSNHAMRAFPLRWRADRGIVERICPHGIGHPDPDQLLPKGDDGTHGCDGCCRNKPKSETPITDSMAKSVKGMTEFARARNLVYLCKKIERESKFYREQLELIAGGKRNTMERRMAKSALTFWDEMQIEITKRKTAKK